MGVPLPDDISTVGALMGEKLVLNEFIAYTDLAAMKGYFNAKSPDNSKFCPMRLCKTSALLLSKSAV